MRVFSGLLNKKLPINAKTFEEHMIIDGIHAILSYVLRYTKGNTRFEEWICTGTRQFFDKLNSKISFNLRSISVNFQNWMNY